MSAAWLRHHPPTAVAAAVACVGLLAGCAGGSTVTVQGPSGGVVSVGPSGGVSVSSSEGSIVVGSQQLPAGWPTAVGQPAGFTVMAAATTKVGGQDAYTASFAADGDQTAAVTSWIDGLVAQGFTKSSILGGAGTAGGIVGLESAQWQVQTITVTAEGKSSLVVTVKPAGS